MNHWLLKKACDFLKKFVFPHFESTAMLEILHKKMENRFDLIC